MSLGERIYKLRTEKNLSQGDLADRLEVSRQSVSKWENNNAVPDLDKIIALSEIFEVSLDVLVKGKTTEVENTDDIPQNRKESHTTNVEKSFPPRKIAGTILFCMGFVVLLFCTLLGGALTGLVFCLPFVVCGIICFVFKILITSEFIQFAASLAFLQTSNAVSKHSQSIMLWTRRSAS